MNITLKKTSLMIFLALTSMSASVAFGQSQFQNGEYVRVADNERNKGGWGKEAQQERGRSREHSDGNGGNNAERNDTRRGGGMSEDQRRALRQQIDEAGREIYQPRR